MDGNAREYEGTRHLFMCAHACVHTVKALYAVLVRAERDYTIQMVLKDIMPLSLHPSRCSGSKQQAAAFAVP